MNATSAESMPTYRDSKTVTNGRETRRLWIISRIMVTTFAMSAFAQQADKSTPANRTGCAHTSTSTSTTLLPGSPATIQKMACSSPRPPRSSARNRAVDRHDTAVGVHESGTCKGTRCVFPLSSPLAPSWAQYPVFRVRTRGGRLWAGQVTIPGLRLCGLGTISMHLRIGLI